MADIINTEVQTEKVDNSGEKPSINDRIIKFGYIPLEEYDRPLTNEEKHQIFGNKDVWWYFLEPQNKAIVADIHKRFKDRPVAVRSIITSLNGNQNVSDGSENFTIISIEELIENGSEYPGAETILAAPLSEDEERLPHRVNQYTSYYRHVYNNSSTEARANTAPAIVVYDLDLLVSVDGGYKFQLPLEPEKRTNAILAVYPFDIEPLKPQV